MYTLKTIFSHCTLHIVTKAYEMERCLLSDLPDGALQAVLNNLNPADHASLREVSRSVCAHITAHIPYISLLLTDNRGLLQQWHQATRSLQHVSNIHIHVPCNITAKVFDEAMQLLSERTSVRELHLLADPDELTHRIGGRASIDTLLPLQHILPSLQTLVITGIETLDLLGDLKQLAAAATAVTAQGWKLQSLTCYVNCYKIRKDLPNGTFPATRSWSEFSQTTLQLPIAFPRLQHLNWKVFVRQYALYDSIHPSSNTGHSAGEGQQQAPELITEEVAKCAVRTAVAHAVLQLKCLKELTIAYIPDVFKGDTAASAVAAALDAILDQSGLPQSLSPAATAAAFKTLDDYGCWLLQHHPKLRKLHIKAGCVMSFQWQQQQQQQPCQRISSSCESGKGCTAVELVDLDLSNDWSQHIEFTQALFKYSSRPASILLNHISGCHLDLRSHHFGVLADLLSGMRSLKHLEVESNYNTDGTGNRHTDASVLAAAVPGLRSLSLRYNGSLSRNSPAVHLRDDLLFPLTAAAGGPGCSLTKLKLSGSFVSTSEVAGDAAAVRATAAGVASLVPGRALHHALLQLGGLRELVIWNLNVRHLLCVSAESLPASLQVLEGHSLCIVSTAAGAAGAGAAGSGECSRNAGCKPLPCTMQATHEAAVVCPHLQRLTLTCCHLSSPSILASDQLQKLDVYGSSWSGGWAAAAAAWPNLKQLAHTAWQGSTRYSSNSSSSVAVRECSAEIMPSRERLEMIRWNLSTTVWDVFDVFRCLRSVCLYHSPVDRQYVDRRQAQSQQVQQSRRAYVWYSIIEDQLLVKCSSVGNMRSSRGPEQGGILKQQHLKHQALEAANSTDQGCAVQHSMSQLTAISLKVAGMIVLLVLMTVAVMIVLERMW